MPEETPTPDLAELTRHIFATAGHRDIEGTGVIFLDVQNTGRLASIGRRIEQESRE